MGLGKKRIGSVGGSPNRLVPTSFSIPVTFSGAWPRSPTEHLVLIAKWNALRAMPTSFSGCSYLVLQPQHGVSNKPGYAPRLLFSSLHQIKGVTQWHKFPYCKSGPNILNYMFECPSLYLQGFQKLCLAYFNYDPPDLGIFLPWIILIKFTMNKYTISISIPIYNIYIYYILYILYIYYIYNIYNIYIYYIYIIHLLLIWDTD